jgi:hypothetical protein
MHSPRTMSAMHVLEHGGLAMKIVKRKTRKAIRKSVKKVLKKHGVAAGLAGSAAAALAKLASTQAPVRKGKKPNLAVMSERVSEGSIGAREHSSIIGHAGLAR